MPPTTANRTRNPLSPAEAAARFRRGIRDLLAPDPHDGVTTAAVFAAGVGQLLLRLRCRVAPILTDDEQLRPEVRRHWEALHDSLLNVGMALTECDRPAV